MRPRRVGTVCGAAAAFACALPAAQVQAVEYLSMAQAQALMFPQAAAFEPVLLALEGAQLKQLAAQAGGPARKSAWRVWRALRDGAVLGHVVADAVIGKMEMIDYAVALDPQGAILDVQILAYRESHGGEVRAPSWRAQFRDKSAAQPLRVGDDIANISGATLSTTHVTDGIRRIAVMARMALVK
jgi:Na+-translocating ferredoxin:NAD+ oxidoreductase RnfG subunit